MTRSSNTGRRRGQPTDADQHARFQGCLLGGAVGDALGAPVEFLSRAGCLERFGPLGITQYASAYGRLGAVTDDTQMTLFTAEGLLRAWVRGCLKGITTYAGVTAGAYLRWLETQGATNAHGLRSTSLMSGWLIEQTELHERRAPGNTCLSSLIAMPSLGAPAVNDSKGCGGVMRMAPVGLFAAGNDRATPMNAFELGNELAALTHGHPTGSLAAGAFSVLVMALARGESFEGALAATLECLRRETHHEETLAALESACALAESDMPRHEAVAALGQGWIAEEALAIGVYCTLVAADFRDGIVLAVNHDGDSDSTGAIAGNLLGAMHGVDVIPAEWLGPLELRSVISKVARDLCEFRDWELGDDAGCSDLTDRVWREYPGH